MNEIPAYVIEGLLAVREAGVTDASMLDRSLVIHLLQINGYINAAAWLAENLNRYMDALAEMEQS